MVSNERQSFGPADSSWNLNLGSQYWNDSHSMMKCSSTLEPGTVRNGRESSGSGKGGGGCERHCMNRI